VLLVKYADEPTRSKSTAGESVFEPPPGASGVSGISNLSDAGILRYGIVMP
jgi:hypothetical protein